MTRSIFFSVSVVIFIASLLVVAKADPVDIKAKQYSDFARVVFEWPGPVGFKANLKGRELTLDFDREIVAERAVIANTLVDYVASVEQPNPKTLKVLLKKQVQLLNRIDNNVITIDLLGETSIPDTAPKAGKSSATIPRVKVRAGVHPDKSRLVFDWPKGVSYDAKADFSSLTLIFPDTVTFDLRSVREGGLKYIDRVEAVETSTGSAVRITKAANAPVKHFQLGTRVVVDIFEPPFQEKRPVAATPEVVESKVDAGETGLVVPKSTEDTKLDKVVSPAEEKTDADEAGGRQAEEKRPNETINDNVQLAIETKTESEPISLKPKSNQETSDDTDAESAKLKSPPAKVDQAEVSRKDAARRDFAATKPHVDENKLVVLIEDGETSSHILFPFQNPVAAAAFERAGNLWVIFGTPREAELARETSETLSVQSVAQVDHPSATILALQLAPGLWPSMRREQATWILELSQRFEPFINAIPRVPDAGTTKGGQLSFPSIENGAPVVFYDSVVLDKLIAIPTLTSGAATETAGQYVEFETLKTIQGIAVRPIVDDIEIDVQRDKVAISSDTGLAISPASMSIGRGQAKLGVAITKSPVMDMLGWRGDSELTLIEARSRLQNNIARSSDASKNRARFELAKMYLAFGMAAEAIGQMSLIDEADSNFDRNHVYRAARGMARYLSRRNDEAREDLFHQDLAQYPDVALWRGALYTRDQDYKKAVTTFPEGVNQLQDIPSRIRQRLLEDWMLAATKTGEEESLIVAMELLNAGEQDERSKAYLAWMRGLQSVRQEKYEDAARYFDAAIEIGYRPVLARTRLDKVNLELSTGKIDNAEAVAELENMYFAWRGDDFELQLLRRVAELKLALGDYREALTLLRNAVTQFPEHPDTKLMADLMDELFEDIYLTDKSDQLEPVTALGLYFDFQELTPVGKEGDELIRRLSDRLADVDLLDKAGELLDHQIKFRLNGVDKARVGARLAVIRLLDGDAEGALKALDISMFNALPAGLKSERQYLRARALAFKGASEEALNLISGDDSGTADLLRADIHWRAQNWRDAATAFDKLIGQRWKEPGPLSQVEGQQIIKLAVSEFLSDDAEALISVRDRYVGLMEKSEYADMFNVITHQVDPSSTKFRDLAPAIASVDKFEAFMDNYREKLKTGGLSALN